MTQTDTAPLANVALFNTMMEAMINRDSFLPGLAVFYGFSGYGKTCSAIYAANKYQAHYLSCGASWTTKRFLDGLCQALGAKTARNTVADQVTACIEVLQDDPLPVIIDEFDMIADRGYVEIIREIQESSDCPFILIGEEHLPNKLKKWERFHNRVLVWQMAMPVSRDEIDILANIFVPQVTISRDLLDKIDQCADGRTRRVMVNLSRCKEMAKTRGQSSLSMDDWGDQPFYTGHAPTRRK